MQKTENFLFQRFSSTSAFDHKVVSKPFSKTFSMSDFGFTQFCMLCLAFPKNIFNLFTEKCEKKRKIHCQTSRTFVFDFKVVSNPISKILPLANFKLFLICFSWKRFQLRPSKIYKKCKKYHNWNLKAIVFHLQVASKSISKILTTTNFGFDVLIYFLYFWRLWFSFLENGLIPFLTSK